MRDILFYRDCYIKGTLLLSIILDDKLPLVLTCWLKCLIDSFVSVYVSMYTEKLAFKYLIAYLILTADTTVKLSMIVNMCYFSDTICFLVS